MGHFAENLNLGNRFRPPPVFSETEYNGPLRQKNICLININCCDRDGKLIAYSGRSGKIPFARYSNNSNICCHTFIAYNIAIAVDLSYYITRRFILR